MLLLRKKYNKAFAGWNRDILNLRSQLCSSHCRLVPGINPANMQVLAFPCIELQEIPPCLILQPVKVLMNNSATRWCISHSSQFCISCKLAKYTLSPFLSVINIYVKMC